MDRKTILCLFLIIFRFTFIPDILAETPEGKRILDHVVYLSSEDLQGRETGTPGYELAVRWVQQQFEECGIEPAGEDGTYIQQFHFPYFKADFEYPELRIDQREYSVLEDDFRIPWNSGGGRIAGPVVFVGYGISCPEKGLDEYANLDVRRKIVLMMDGAPENGGPWQHESKIQRKIETARKRGAVGLLLCREFRQRTRSLAGWRLPIPGFQEGFPVFQVDGRVADFLLRRDEENLSQLRRRIQELQEQIDQKCIPVSFVSGRNARMALRVEAAPVRIGKNVLGKIDGSDPALKEEAIVVGAHLDHLGVCYGKIYPGADDNASGVGVLLELARVIKSNQIRPRRTILFAAWGGEELGLYGSTHFIGSSLWPADRISLNLNMDMVGRGDRLHFSGVYFAPEIWDVFRSELAEESIHFLSPGRGGPGGSDHTAFITQGIPAFALMTLPWQAHTDYHQPTDTAEKLDVNLLQKVASVVYDLIMSASNQREEIDPKRTPRYLHKSAQVVNLYPVSHRKESALGLLPAEWIDRQFIEIDAESGSEAESFQTLVEALDEWSVKYSRGPEGRMAEMFNEAIGGETIPWIGIRSTAIRPDELNKLRTLCKVGLQTLCLDGKDTKWFVDDTLSEAGKKAIALLNARKILIQSRNLSESQAESVMRCSENAVVLGIRYQDYGEKLLSEIEEDGSVLAVPWLPGQENGMLEISIPSLLTRIRSECLLLVPSDSFPFEIDELDRLLNITETLYFEGVIERDILNLLGESVMNLCSGLRPEEETRRFAH